METMEKKAPNYLEFIPVINDKFKYEIVDGKVTVLQENTGFFNFLAQKLFKKPRISQIHLDEMGNFIWPLLDGKRNILEIADLVDKEFGEKAAPLYDRLVHYMKTLESYGFIVIKKDI